VKLKIKQQHRTDKTKAERPRLRPRQLVIKVEAG